MKFLLTTFSLFSWKMEADTMVVKNTTNGVVTHVDFRQRYNSISLVFTMATDASFDVYIIEPDGDDGPYRQMSAVPYIAIEEGNHELPNRTKILASKISTNKFQGKFVSGKSWENISLSGFSSTPVVLAT